MNRLLVVLIGLAVITIASGRRSPAQDLRRKLWNLLIQKRGGGKRTYFKLFFDLIL